MMAVSSGNASLVEYIISQGGDPTLQSNVSIETDMNAYALYSRMPCPRRMARERQISPRAKP
jgi:hypothetical protein